MVDPSPQRHRIGQVCDLLREQFPDISISKLRFLEERGIVEPHRTPGGYRMYSEDDVAALRVALTMQRDQFMPLRVIQAELRRRIAAGTLDQAVRSGAALAGTGAGPGQLDAAHDAALVSAEAAARAAAADPEFVFACRDAGLIEGRDLDGDVLFSADEVRIVRCAAQLDRLGLELRHVRQCAASAARQGALVEGHAATLLRAPGDHAQARGHAVVQELTTLLGELMALALARDVRAMVARTSRPSSPVEGTHLQQ